MRRRKPDSGLAGLLAFMFRTYVIPFAILFIVLAKVYHHVPRDVKATVFNDWSDGRIAFASNREGSWDIFSVSPDGTGLTRLTSTSHTDETHPSWSSDGMFLVFQSMSDGNYDIEIMRSDGQNRKRLTRTGQKDVDPVFSPDGGEIAFTSYRDGDAEIYVMNRDGSNVRNISISKHSDTSPSWSHDGQKIYYRKRNEKRSTRLYVVNSFGLERMEISEMFPYLGDVPSWNGRGTKVAFTGGRLARQEKGVIYTMRPRASGFRALFSNPDGVSDGDPAWSPDGGSLVFCRTSDSGVSDICIANPDGSGFLNLTDGTGSNSEPSWGTDPLNHN